jgi:hypothetical protein
MLRSLLLASAALLPSAPAAAAAAAAAASYPSFSWPTAHHDTRNSGSTPALGPGAAGACLSDVVAAPAGVRFEEPGVTGSEAQPAAWYACASDNRVYVGAQPAAMPGGDWGVRSFALVDVWRGSAPAGYPATPFGCTTSPTARAGAPDGGDQVFVASGDGYVYALNINTCLAQGAGSAGCAAWAAPFGSTLAPALGGPQGFFTSPRLVSRSATGLPRSYLVVAETSAAVNANGIWHGLDADTGALLWSTQDYLDATVYGVFGLEPCLNEAGAYPTILFLPFGANVVAVNLTSGATLDFGGAGGAVAVNDPVSSPCTMLDRAMNSTGKGEGGESAVFVQKSGEKEEAVFRFNLDPDKPNATEPKGRGFYSYWDCSYTPGSSACKRLAPRPPAAAAAAPAAAAAAAAAGEEDPSAPVAGGFYQPTNAAQRDELHALLVAAHARAHGAARTRRVMSGVETAIAARRRALLVSRDGEAPLVSLSASTASAAGMLRARQNAALARGLDLAALGALVAPSGYRRRGHPRFGQAAPAGWVPTAVPTLAQGDAFTAIVQHNPASPFATKAQVPSGAVFFVNDNTHVVAWQLRGVGALTDDFSSPFYSVANSASSVTIDGAGIAYVGADLNNM